MYWVAITFFAQLAIFVFAILLVIAILLNLAGWLWQRITRRRS